MKKWILICYVGVICGETVAQQKSAPKKPAVVKKQSQPKALTNDTLANLNNVGAHPAKGNNAASSLYIADPVIKAFNLKSNGYPVRLSGSGILGSPRGTYGFANGQILLRTTDATSHGGNTGTGSVGTGSTVGGLGTGGMVPIVNGKNVYAGPLSLGFCTQPATSGFHTAPPS